MLNKKDFSEECRQLDATLNSLRSLHSTIVANNQLAAELPGRKSKRLAKALRIVRKHAEDLYSAVSKGWVTTCHHKHLAKLVLEDRLEQSTQRLPKSRDKPIQCFEFVFSGNLAQGHDFWHESVVQIFENDDDDDETVSDPSPVSGDNPVRPRVSINVPTPIPAARTRDIPDICSAIEAGRSKQEHVIFALTKDCRMGEPISRKRKHMDFPAKDVIRLKDHLCLSRDPVSSISWSDKVSLALTIASSFLQLLRTPWTSPRFSTDTLTLLQAANQDPDMTKPCLSISFEPAPGMLPTQNADFEIKEALVELGIMLLEIWHERTVELKFGLAVESLRPLARRTYAMEWLETVPGLPVMYHQAIYYCLAGVINKPPLPKGWDDPQLWETICETVIEPLSKLAKS
jgi:hypothetical protein